LMNSSGHADFVSNFEFHIIHPYRKTMTL